MAEVFGEPDLELRTVLALAAQGWPVVMPDYPGFVDGSLATGYMFAEDEAYALLDAPHAMQKLLGEARPKVVMVGHSQGGHGVLSAQAYAQRYSTAGTLAGVVALAPFWAPARTFGIILAQYPVVDPQNWYVVNTAIEYFYTHAELYEGAGAGLKLFNIAPGQLQASDVTPLLSSCNFAPDLSPLTHVDTFISPESQAVAACAALGQCNSPAAGVWAPRMRADRPALNPRGAPVVVWQGGADAVVPSAISGCANDKLTSDLVVPGATASLQICGDQDAQHESVENRNAAWVIQWIKARNSGGVEPNSCTPLSGLGCEVMNID